MGSKNLELAAKPSRNAHEPTPRCRALRAGGKPSPQGIRRVVTDINSLAAFPQKKHFTGRPRSRRPRNCAMASARSASSQARTCKSSHRGEPVVVEGCFLQLQRKSSGLCCRKIRKWAM